MKLFDANKILFAIPIVNLTVNNNSHCTELKNFLKLIDTYKIEIKKKI